MFNVNVIVLIYTIVKALRTDIPNDKNPMTHRRNYLDHPRI